jgi:hypothetical protein
VAQQQRFQLLTRFKPALHRFESLFQLVVASSCNAHSAAFFSDRQPGIE